MISSTKEHQPLSNSEVASALDEVADLLVGVGRDIEHVGDRVALEREIEGHGAAHVDLGALGALDRGLALVGQCVLRGDGAERGHVHIGGGGSRQASGLELDLDRLVGHGHGALRGEGRRRGLCTRRRGAGYVTPLSGV